MMSLMWEELLARRHTFCLLFVSDDEAHLLSHSQLSLLLCWSVTMLSVLVSLQPKKLGFSNLTHLRRRRSDESTEYVCPIESSSPQSGQSAVNGVQMRPYAGFRGLSPILDREPDRSRDQVGLDDSRADPSP